jgi:hypothetical protein
VRQLFLSHRGSLSHLARELAIYPATLSNWFHRGDPSARIAAAVYATAQQLTQIDQDRAIAQQIKALDEEIKELKKRKREDGEFAPGKSVRNLPRNPIPV